MRFIVDAHLPRTICRAMARQGHDAVHTSDLPAENATKDGVINRISLGERRVVISKDWDFYYSHLLQGRPWKLLFVRTGNLPGRAMLTLVERNLTGIVTALDSHSLVELDQASVTPMRRVG